MSERRKRRIGDSQQSIPDDRPAFIVRTTGRLDCPYATVEGNSHLKACCAALIGFVTRQEVPRFGNIVHEEASEVPSGIPASTFTEIDNARDSSLVHQDMGGVEATVQ